MKFLIVGSGMIGRTHARALQTLRQEFALCDSLRRNVEAVGAEFGVTELYTDFEEAIVRSGADAVIVCTPNHLHAPVAVCAMEHGCDVLCEKPMAATSEQARAMWDAARRTGRRMMIGYILRAGDALSGAKEALEGGSLGRVLSARCVLAAPETLEVAKTPYRRSYETGGGIIYDYTHEIDYIRYLLGEPAQGFCFCGCFLRQEQSVDDSADSLLRFADGTAAHLHMDYLQERGRGRGRCFELVCEKGFLSCDFKSLQIFYNDGRDVCETFVSDWDAPFVRQLERFMKLCAGGEVSCATADDGLRVMEIADALYASAHTGKMIEL